jgi:hypothetical protein
MAIADRTKPNIVIAFAGSEASATSFQEELLNQWRVAFHYAA